VAGNGQSKWLHYSVATFVSFAILVGIAFAKSTDTRLIKNTGEHVEIRSSISGVKEMMAAQVVETKYLSKIMESHGTRQDKMLALLEKLNGDD